MKEENKIDHLFREGIQRHYPVDESLWAQIESQLPTQQSPSSFFSLNSLLFFLVIFCCSLIPRDNTYSQQNNTSINQSLSVKPSNTIDNPSNLVSINHESITPKLAKNKSSQQQTDKIKTASLQVSRSNLPHVIVPSTLNEKSVSDPHLSQVESTYTSNKTKLTNWVNVAKEESSVTLASNFIITKKQFIGQKIPKIDLIDLELFPLSNTYSPQQATKLERPVHRPIFQFFEIDFSNSVFIQKNVRSNIPGFARYKETTEQPSSNYTAGINTVRQKKHLIYGLGVQFNKYVEKVSYDIETEATSYFIKTDTNYRVVNTQFNSNGTPVLLIEPVLTENKIPTTVIVNDKLIATNTIERVRIPVFAGYNFNFKNWSTELRTALIPSFLFQSQGITIRQSQDQIEPLNTETTEQFTLSLNNQLRVGYAINESFAIGTSIYIENDLKSYSKEIDSKLNHQGLGIWVAIKP